MDIYYQPAVTPSEVPALSLSVVPAFSIKLQERKLTPLRAIRLYCLWCHKGSSAGVKECLDTACPLWHYRSGRRPQSGTTDLTPIQAIRARCLNCSGSERKEVKNCLCDDCSLFCHRKPLARTDNSPVGLI